MAMLVSRIRFIVGAMALALIVAVATPAGAQQRNPDSSVNPTASSVKEDQLLNELNRISGRCTIPDQKACTIEQPAGRDWRHFHQVTLRWIGAISILGMLAILVVFYLVRGMVRIESGRSGRPGGECFGPNKGQQQRLAKRPERASRMKQVAVIQCTKRSAALKRRMVCPERPLSMRTMPRNR